MDTPTFRRQQSLAGAVGKQSLKEAITAVRVGVAGCHWAEPVGDPCGRVCGGKKERTLENLLFGVQIHSAGDLWPLAGSGGVCENVTLSMTC